MKKIFAIMLIAVATMASCEVRINGAVIRTGGMIHTPEPTNQSK